MLGISREELAAHFGVNLRRRRRRLALSQEQLAKLAAVHRTEIGLLENGRRLPRIDTVIKLAASLEVTPNDLFDGIEWLPLRDPPKGRYRTLSPFDARGKGGTDG